jgi:membrane protein implicated in regulation of membrane protease activity
METPGSDNGNSKVEIPILTKESKERKAGAGLLPGVPEIAAGVRLGEAKAAGGLLAYMTSKAALAAFALCVGVAGLVGYGALKGRLGGAPGPAKAVNLSPIESSVHVRTPDSSRSLNYLADASKGEIQWDAASPKPEAKPAAAGPEAKEATSADAPADKAGATQPAADQTGAAGGLGHDLNGAKLSQGFGGSSAFGNKSIFGGGNGKFTPKQVGAGALARAGVAKTPSGKLSNFRSLKAASSRGTSTKGVKSQRAMGQLKFADSRSRFGAANASQEGGHSYAADAFEQGKTQGGELSGPGGAGPSFGDKPVAPVGSGAPSDQNQTTAPCPADYTPVDGGGCQPPTAQGQNVTPYQGQVDAAQSMTTMALILAVLGLALLAIGYANTPWPWAYALIGVGIALLAVAIVMALMAQSMGSSIGNQYGQQEQNNVIQQQSTSASKGKQSTYQGKVGESKGVQGDAQDERNATYDSGGK